MITRLSVFLRTTGRKYVALTGILLGLAAAISMKTWALAPVRGFNAVAFQSLSDGMDNYRSFKVPFRPRILTNYLAAKASSLGDLVAQWRGNPEGAISYTIALWSVLWFLLIGAVYIISTDKRAIFYLFGTFAAIQFGYSPERSYIYPWDMPALFVFVVFTVLFARRMYLPMLLLIPLGMTLKETSIVLCLAFLFCDLPWKRRISLAFISFLSCAAVKIAIDIYAQAPIAFFTMQVGSEDQLHFVYNMKRLRAMHFVPVLVNAGTLLALFVLPALNRTVLAFKAIAVVFLGSILSFGLIGEYRIFFEMVPFALYSLMIFSFGDSFMESEDRWHGVRTPEPLGIR